MALQFVTTSILARLLPQSAYGHMSFIGDLVSFINIFAMTNFVVHSLQLKEHEEVPWQDHFTASVVLNLAMFVVINIIGIVFWWLPGWRELAPFVHVMSATFILGVPKEFRLKMLERSFNWKRLRILHGIGMLASTLLAIIMAWAGCGTYSLLVPGLCTTLPFAYDLWVKAHWRPNWQWSWARYAPTARFAVGRMGSGMAFYGRQMLISMVVGGMLSFDVLGVLNRSLGLAQMFCINIAAQLLSSLYPILARVDGGAGHPARVGSLVVQTIVWMAIPTGVAFVISATPLVMLVYGRKWAAIIPLIPWAMGWGIAFSLYLAVYNLLIARSRQRECFYADMANLVGTAAALYWALPHGLDRYLQAMIGVQVSVFLAVTRWLRQAEGITLAGWLMPVATGAAAAWLSALGTMRILQICGQSGTTALVPCILASLGFCIGYVLVLRVCFRNRLHHWLNYVPMQKVARRLLLLPHPV